MKAPEPPEQQGDRESKESGGLLLGFLDGCCIAEGIATLALALAGKCLLVVVIGIAVIVLLWLGISYIASLF